MGRHPLDARAFFRVFPGVAQGDAPVHAGRGLVDIRGAGAEVDGEVRVADLVVMEVLLDHIAAVAEGQDEVLVSVAGVALHDMPHDRQTAHFDHGFGLELGFLAQACALAAAEYDDLHSVLVR